LILGKIKSINMAEMMETDRKQKYQRKKIKKMMDLYAFRIQ